MRRRDFVLSALAGVAVHAGPASAQTARPKKLGVLAGGPNDPIFEKKYSAFLDALAKAGWKHGRNLDIVIKWGNNNASLLVKQARELVDTGPDVILVGPTNALKLLKAATTTIPLVFVQVSDPVGQGHVKSLARPSGNITGFSNLEFSLVGKWLQLVKEIVPDVKRIGLMIHVSNAVSRGWYDEFRRIAPQLSFEPIAAPYHDRSEIEGIVKMLGLGAEGALVCPGDSYTDSAPIRDYLITLTSKYAVPAVHSQRDFVVRGGLASYGIDQLEQYRGAASYIDRILRGEEPADLPVQQPSKFNLTINSKTAKVLGLNLHPNLLARADEIIE
jgi:putative ABC transport system substrate-binding protein